MITFIGYVNLDRLADLGKMVAFLKKKFYPQTYRCVFAVFIGLLPFYGRIIK